jgi:hypothetical protein
MKETVGSGLPPSQGSTIGDGPTSLVESIQPTRRMREYEFSIEGHAVTFAQLVQAHYGMRDQSLPEELRDTYAYYYSHLKREFDAAKGAMVDLHFCNEVPAGAILTSRDELHFYYPAGRAHETLEAQLFRCGAMARQANQLITSRARTFLVTRLFSISISLLAVIDRSAGFRGDVQSKIEQQTRAAYTASLELNTAGRLLMLAATRGAQLTYLMGSLLGLSAIAIVIGLVLIGGAVGFWSRVSFQEASIPVTIVAGAVGATLSVMTRMSSGSLTVDPWAGARHVRVLGLLRPAIGAVSALALYVLLIGGLSPATFELPAEPEVRVYFLAAIGFLAGFSERWAKDVLTQAAPTGTTTAPETPTESSMSHEYQIDSTTGPQRVDFWRPVEPPPEPPTPRTRDD